MKKMYRVGVMRLIYEMLKVRFKVEECEDHIYEEEDEEDEGEGDENESEEKEEAAPAAKKAKPKQKTETAPVILSCVGWNTKNMARAALQS